MRKFIDREQELEFLTKKYQSGEAELIVLYGRRRIGKTELLLRFAQDRPVIYFLGRMESGPETIRRFNRLLAERFEDRTLLDVPLPGWDAILEYMAKRMESRAVVILDEFPFIVDRFPEIVSILQDKWDSMLGKTKMMLVLTGSSVGMMEKHALSYKSPLYGRRTGQWQLAPMPLRCLREFFPSYSIEDLFRVYATLDAIPGYLAKFSPDKEIWENIEEKVLSKGEFLYEEVEMLMREELRDPSNYMSILSAIAGGATALNEIRNRTQLDKSLLSKYIFTLMNLGIVERRIPVTESYKGRLGAKGAIYFLKDNFIDFWFRFVYLNKQRLEAGETDSVLDDIKREFNRYISIKFEDIVSTLVPYLHVIDATRIGRWWHKDREIDVVALDERNKEVLFCECKWEENVDAEKILEHLRTTAAHVDWHRKKRKEHYAIFARSFERKVDGCFDMNDIENLIQGGTIADRHP